MFPVVCSSNIASGLSFSTFFTNLDISSFCLNGSPIIVILGKCIACLLISSVGSSTPLLSSSIKNENLPMSIIPVKDVHVFFILILTRLFCVFVSY